MSKRLVAVLLVLTMIFTMGIVTTASAKSAHMRSNSSENTALIRFIPTEMDYHYNKTVVRGYFVNLHQDRTVSNFTNFKMELYKDGKLMLTGKTSALKKFSLKSNKTKFYTFSWSGYEDMPILFGDYYLGQNWNAIVTFDYKYGK